MYHPMSFGIIIFAVIVNPPMSLQGLETPYVVKLHQCHVIHDEKPVFTFIHPNHSPEPIDNTRYDCLAPRLLYFISGPIYATPLFVTLALEHLTDTFR